MVKEESSFNEEMEEEDGTRSSKENQSPQVMRQSRIRTRTLELRDIACQPFWCRELEGCRTAN